MFNQDNLRLIVMDNFKELGSKVNQEIQSIRNTEQDFRVPIKLTRFSDGEGKVTLEESIRGKDVYILSDIKNYNITYKMYNLIHHMSPDEHFQDIIRTIYAMMGHAYRINVVMPFLYESRQHRRRERESLDCAAALNELRKIGVQEIITLDAHDPNVQNAIPLMPFDSFYPTKEMLEAFMLYDNPDFDFSNTMVISPDAGAFARASFLAKSLKIESATFDKRRDRDTVVDGKNPILSDIYIGSDVTNKDIIVTDDMLSSGESLIRVAKDLKLRGANKIYFFVSFALFTKGYEEFENAYNEGLFQRLYAANLNYVPKELLEKEWFVSVDCTKKLAKIIDRINNDKPIGELLNDRCDIATLKRTKK